MKLDEYSYHEAIDRTYLIIDNLEKTVYQHPVIKKHKKVKKKLKKALTLLAEVYVDITGIREEIDQTLNK